MHKHHPKYEKHKEPKRKVTGYILKLEHFIKLMKKHLIYLTSWGSSDHGSRITKQGHFTVVAIGGREPKKFVVALGYLSYPPFVRLLEAAEREFGFKQQGLLNIPCEASELQNILLDKIQQDHSKNSKLSCSLVKEIHPLFSN